MNGVGVVAEADSRHNRSYPDARRPRRWRGIPGRAHQGVEPSVKTPIAPAERAPETPAVDPTEGVVRTVRAADRRVGPPAWTGSGGHAARRRRGRRPRFRLAVQPADHPAGARVRRLLRARAPRRALGRDRSRSHPKGVILSGGPASVYEPGAPQLPDWVLEQRTCRCSASATACSCWPRRSAARSTPAERREYGPATIAVVEAQLAALRRAAETSSTSG